MYLSAGANWFARSRDRDDVSGLSARRCRSQQVVRPDHDSHGSGGIDGEAKRWVPLTCRRSNADGEMGRSADGAPPWNIHLNLLDRMLWGRVVRSIERRPTSAALKERYRYGDESAGGLALARLWMLLRPSWTSSTRWSEDERLKFEDLRFVVRWLLAYRYGVVHR